MVRFWREVRYRTDYILGTDFRLFRNVAVRNPWHNSDHYMVLGCLNSYPLREHTEYLGWRIRPPPPPPTTLTREDGFFASLRRAIPKPKTRESRKNVWISEDKWRLVNEKVPALRGP